MLSDYEVRENRVFSGEDSDLDIGLGIRMGGSWHSYIQNMVDVSWTKFFATQPSLSPPTYIFLFILLMDHVKIRHVNTLQDINRVRYLLKVILVLARITKNMMCIK